MTAGDAGARRAWDPWKRVADLIGASTLLVLFAPLLLVLAVVVRAGGGGPALYRQTRPGRDGVPFRILKFRSMRPDAALELAGTEGDHLRITRVGRFLRATSLDELPNLVNVVRGEMSLIGPRPLLVSYLDHYSERQARRHEVRPGMTGLAQVRGRNAIDWASRLEYDVEYVERRSPVLDLQILVATVRTVLSRHGIAQPGHATMPTFEGTDPSPRASAVAEHQVEHVRLLHG